MLLSGKAIEHAVQSGEIGIRPFVEKNVKGASYTFTLAPKIDVPRKADVVSLTTGLKFSETTMESGGFVLQPNQFVLGYSTEILSLNGKFGCFLSTRGSCAQIGLSVLLSSSFAEPDTDSQITLEIHNASVNPILLTPGMMIVKGIFIRVE